MDVRRGPEGEPAAIHDNFPGVYGIRPEDRPRELGPPRAHEPGDPQDFPAKQIEGDIVQDALAREAADLEELLRRGHIETRRKLVLQLASHHPVDDLFHSDGGIRVRAHVVSVAEDRDPVHDMLELLQPMRDVNDGDPTITKGVDDSEKLVDLRLAEGARRLIHDEHFRIE